MRNKKIVLCQSSNKRKHVCLLQLLKSYPLAWASISRTWNFSCLKPLVYIWIKFIEYRTRISKCGLTHRNLGKERWKATEKGLVEKRYFIFTIVQLIQGMMSLNQCRELLNEFVVKVHKEWVRGEYYEDM